MTNKPEVLYHYTDAKGLTGILQGKLWATSILHLNDSQEFAYFRDAVLESTRPKISEKNIPLDFNTLIDAIRDTEPSRFVFCLCDGGDQLSQWRGYCPPGNGYSIGFDRRSLPESIGQEAGIVIKCTYGLSDAAATSLIADIGNDLVNKLILLPGKISPRSPATRDAIRPFIVGIGSNAHRFKHPGFKEENEWRMVLSPEVGPSLSLRYRASGFGVVPYLEVPFLDSTPRAIKKIFIGPGRHSELGKKTVKGLLAANGWQGVDVDVSKIPYRT